MKPPRPAAITRIMKLLTRVYRVKAESVLRLPISFILMPVLSENIGRITAPTMPQPQKRPYYSRFGEVIPRGEEVLSMRVRIVLNMPIDTKATTRQKTYCLFLASLAKVLREKSSLGATGPGGASSLTNSSTRNIATIPTTANT